MAPSGGAVSAPAPAPQNLPAVAVLADGRFALRIALRHGDATHVWEVRRFVDEREGHVLDGSAVSGWAFDRWLSDAELVQEGATTVEPLSELARLAEEMETVGQFVAARMLRERATRVRHAGVGLR